MKNIYFLLLAILVVAGCSSDDDNTTDQDANVTFVFTQNWDGTDFTNANLGNTNYTNENGDVLNIERLRYLISNVKLKKANGEIVAFDGYHLVDVSQPGTLSFSPTLDAPLDTYTGISFIFGLEEANNISGAYPDLNAVSWNWPDMLGGGYHFMQMDGNYQTEDSSFAPFNFHHGTARVSEGVFEQNFFEVDLPGFTITSDIDIEIEMNIAEWFKNPNTWDLNVYNTDLMMNYTAQKLIQQNGATVFSLGTVNQ